MSDKVARSFIVRAVAAVVVVAISFFLQGQVLVIATLWPVALVALLYWLLEQWKDGDRPVVTPFWLASLTVVVGVVSLLWLGGGIFGAASVAFFPLVSEVVRGLAVLFLNWE